MAISKLWACLDCTNAQNDYYSGHVTHSFDERCPLNGLTFAERQTNRFLGAWDLGRSHHWLADTWLGAAWGYTKLTVVRAIS